MSNPTVNQTFQVSIQIASITDLYAFQFDLSYDPTILSVSSMTEGAFLSAGGPTVFIPGIIDNAGGHVTFIADSLVGPVSGAAGSGTLATIMFTAKTAGASALSLGNVILLDSALNDIMAAVQSGSVTATPPGTPTITSVTTAYGSAAIAQNTWIAIQGANLTPADTPMGGVFWSNAPSFAADLMPTQLGSISITVNGLPAFIWWFCSAATTSACASDQINVLTPLDNALGTVQVVVTNGSASTVPFSVDKQAISPSFLLFDAVGHIAARHADFSLLAPAALYPGASTPAHAGETILLYGTGFGLPSSPVVNGSDFQFGPIVPSPSCTIGSLPAIVAAAYLISPGLYQFNVVVPLGSATGDNQVVCAFEGANTPQGAIIPVI